VLIPLFLLLSEGVVHAAMFLFQVYNFLYSCCPWTTNSDKVSYSCDKQMCVRDVSKLVKFIYFCEPAPLVLLFIVNFYYYFQAPGR